MSEAKGLLRGSIISIVGQAIGTVVRLGSNILLAYLLVPELFGVATLVNTVIIGLEMISDIGLELNIIQSERGEEETFLHTAFTVQVMRGVLLLLASCAVGFPMAWFYETPELAALIPFAGVGALLRALTPTKLALARRHVRLDRVVAVELGSQIAGTIVMVAHAYVYRSVWSLVLGSAVMSGFRALFTVFLPGKLDRLRFDKEAFDSIFGFAKWVIISTMLTFAADRFVVLSMGKLADVAMLGVYGVASTLAIMPVVIGGHAINSVLLPALSAAARDSRQAMETALDRSRRAVIPVFMFFILGLALMAHPFFDLLYEDEWSDAPWMVQLSLVGVWFAYFHEAWSRVLVAVGDTRSLAQASVARLIGTIAGCTFGYLQFGVPGLILGAALGNILGYAAVTWALHRHDVHTAGADIGYTLLCLAIGLAGIEASQVVAERVSLAPWMVSIATGTPILLVVGAWAALRIKNRAA